MIEIRDLSDAEITELLQRTGYGHLACSRNDEPYVVPVHFAFDDGVIYVYTTQGKKFEIIKANPRVCLQAEDVRDNQHWQSVIVDGEASPIVEEMERERAIKLITATNPKLTPAVSVRWMDSWVRENIEVIYRIFPLRTSGRATVDKKPGPIVPGHRNTIN
jgi:nitroimidazol reductase NimA-like FMN-containing flavoprotein (pyridoxamine 5'-phosphate oxidase superfamily)